MKTLLRRLYGASLTWTVLAMVVSSVAFGAVGITVSPSVISNTYVGMVTVQITGLSDGETVLLQRFLDANANGVVDGPDWQMDCVRVTDGFVPKIGGVTNYAVPFDSTGTNGTIIVQLNYCSASQLDHFVGQHLFRVIGQSGQATATFIVTNVPYTQAITGTVRCTGTNVPYPVVVFLTAEGELVGGVVGGSTGGFTNRLPVGTYVVLGFRPGYLVDLGNTPVVTLVGGGTVSTNVDLVGATRLISGRVVDAANTNIGLPGLLLFTETDTGQMALDTTDTNGYFSLPVGVGSWVIEPDKRGLNRLGYVGLDEDILPVFDTTVGSVTNAFLAVPRANALFYGSVCTVTGVPLAGVFFHGAEWTEGFYSTAGLSDTNGIYAACLLGDHEWHLWPDYEENHALGYIFSSGTNTYVASNQAIRVDFVAVPVTGTISGWVGDTNGNPAPGLGVYAWADIGTNHFDVYTETAADGTFTLRVADGAWHVGVNCWPLLQHGYQCPGEQIVSVPPTNPSVNFLVYPIPPLQITTTTLPGGQVGTYYYTSLDVSGGVSPYTWSLAPGSGPLPPGLTLWDTGQIWGTPTTAGTFNFTVMVTDYLGNWTNKQLSITVAPRPPLTITTVGLPNGQVWSNYFALLNATGGVPPYTWSLATGSNSLPPGLTLWSDGRIEGVPVTNGTFNFTVCVTDSVWNSTNKTFTITIAPPPSLVPVIESPQRLSTGEFLFRFNTITGARYTLLYSTNLVNWTPIITFSGSGGPITIIDPDTSAPVRFYRIRVQM